MYSCYVVNFSGYWDGGYNSSAGSTDYSCFLAGFMLMVSQRTISGNNSMMYSHVIDRRAWRPA